MKYMIASDIHGSVYYTEKLLEIFKSEKADKLILLGDIYYHGPRNPLTENYYPFGVSTLLNGVKDKLIVIKGNCDSDVDQMVSEFKFHKHKTLKINGKTLFITHGDKYNADNRPKSQYDILCYGHFHTGFIEVADKIICNPGSVSLPKNDTCGYLIIENHTLSLKNLDMQTISSTDF